MAELHEIKKGQTGNGLLIDNDGYMQLSEERILKEGINAEGGWHVPHPFVVDAVFQKFGIKNANGRIYPEDVLKREVERYQQLIADNRALGELNHPETSSLDLSRISHNIIELHWEGRTLVGKLVLNTSEGFRRQGIVTTCGDEAANLMLNGFKIGVSSRAIGSVEEKLGVLYVGQDLEIVGFDLVATPSTCNAFLTLDGPEGLRPYIESKETDTTKSSINEKINKIKHILH